MPTTVATHNPTRRREKVSVPSAPGTRQEVAWLGRFQSSRRRGALGRTLSAVARARARTRRPRGIEYPG